MTLARVESALTADDKPATLGLGDARPNSLKRSAVQTSRFAERCDGLVEVMLQVVRHQRRNPGTIAERTASSSCVETVEGKTAGPI